MKYFGDRLFSSWANRGNPEDEMASRLEKIREKATRFNETYEEKESTFVVEEIEMTTDFADVSEDVLPEEAELERDPWDTVTMHGGRL